MLVSVTSCVGTPRTSTDPVTYADQLLKLTNQVRTDQGLEPLAPSTCAREAAVMRAGALVGSALEHRPLEAVGRRCRAERTAENMVRSGANPKNVVAAWMKSAGHRNNIIDPELNEIGVGCVQDDGGMLCSQVFLGAE